VPGVSHLLIGYWHVLQQGNDNISTVHMHHGMKAAYIGTMWIGVWVGPRTGLDLVVKKKIRTPVGNRTPAIQSVAICYID
jgi:hypothetical protein